MNARGFVFVPLIIGIAVAGILGFIGGQAHTCRQARDAGIKCELVSPFKK